MDFLISQMDSAFAEFTELLKNEKFKAESPDTRLVSFQKKYGQLNKLFPIPLRYMIEHESYDSTAFKKYLTALDKTPYKSKEEFCNRQADYLYFLYLEINKDVMTKEPHSLANKRLDLQAKNYRNATVKILLAEIAADELEASKQDQRSKSLYKKIDTQLRNELKSVVKLI